MKGGEHLWTVLNENLETLRATQQWPEAIRVAERALELATRTFSSTDPRLVSSYEQLGLLYDEQGDFAGAKRSFAKAHQLLEMGEPQNDAALFFSSRRLARIHDQLGESEEALSYFERAIAAGSQPGSVPYSDLGTLLNNAALTFRKAGRARAAEPYYLHALQIYEKELGPDHPDVAAVLNNLAVFYTNEKRFSEAEQLHLRALAVREKAYSATHPDVAQSKCNLAVVYHSRGDYERAGELYRDSLATWEKAMEQPPPDYETVASNYADLLRSLGQARKARELEAHARQRRAR
ncbi:MAG: tetratricopeptide repeat protein [Verrucomicrobiota bacterium]